MDLSPPNGDGFCINIGHLKALFETSLTAGVAGPRYSGVARERWRETPINKQSRFGYQSAGKSGNGNGRRSLPDMIWKKPRKVKKTRAYRAFRIAILRQNPLTFGRAR